MISAINHLDINETKQQRLNGSNKIYFLNFKDVSNDSSKLSFANQPYITLAYLIGENKQFQQPQSSAKFSLNFSAQFNAVKSQFLPLQTFIKIDEMRNGLYALKFQSEFYNKIKFINTNNVNEPSMPYYNFTIEFILKMSDIITNKITNITSFLSFKIPAEFAYEHKLKSIDSDFRLEFTTSKSVELDHLIKDIKTSDSITSAPFAYFNSFMIVSITSVLLILIGLGCFIVSLFLFYFSKLNNVNSVKKSLNDRLITKQMPIKKVENNLFNSSTSIESDSAHSATESGIISDVQTGSSSASSIMHQSLSESLNHNSNTLRTENSQQIQQNAIMVYDTMPSKLSIDKLDTFEKKASLVEQIYNKTNKILAKPDHQICALPLSTESSYSNNNFKLNSNPAANNISQFTAITTLSNIKSPHQYQSSLFNLVL